VLTDRLVYLKQTASAKPGAVQNWKTADEVMTEEIQKFSQTVALDF